MAKELTPKTGAKKTATASTIETLMNEGGKTARVKADKELKTEHPSLSIEPSVWAEFKLLAKAKNTTPNGLFADLVKETVASNQDKIKKYLELINS